MAFTPGLRRDDSLVDGLSRMENVLSFQTFLNMGTAQIHHQALYRGHTELFHSYYSIYVTVVVSTVQTLEQSSGQFVPSVRQLLPFRKGGETVHTLNS